MRGHENQFWTILVPPHAKTCRMFLLLVCARNLVFNFCFAPPNSPPLNSPPLLTPSLRSANVTFAMSTNQTHPLGALRILERVAPSAPGITDLPQELRRALEGLALPADTLRNKRIAVAIGSRGIAGIDLLARELCHWLMSQGARPFVFPAMGSHGGATAEGQKKVLEQ